MKRGLGERASDFAYRRLRQEIVELEIEPGAVIAEVETAARLGVSRTPLREATARLLADGLLIPDGARGVAVAPISAEDVTRLTELREALDAQAARLAAQRRDAAGRAEFEDLAGRFARLAADPGFEPGLDLGFDLAGEGDPSATERTATYALAARLDEAIDRAADNPVLAASLGQVRLRLARVRRLAQDRPDRLAEAAQEHRAIAEAIAWGDAELAGSAVRVHLRRSLAHALARLDDHHRRAAFPTADQKESA
ncbi:GntR family transcriptional regulator [Leucobacter weissii]|uniref:GntR family transcriptional regulator n=1 Tax=Leucobacter weissii TaxID=1983706 RepID=A0A939MJP4_9MICO|nr:GntR family transcriptional regulator [Leucobacter weissii]MBO1902208.1 GntR family transcriptional regulator [Leucobacter weissii]